MDALINLVAQHSSTLILVLLSVVLVLVGTVIAQSRQLSAFRRKWGAALEGTNGRNLEVILHDHLRERAHQEKVIEDLLNRTGSLEKRMETAKRHTGIVRYDAFPDVGGTQSFSFAVVDDKGDGAIVTCLYGRMDCRVYAKHLEGGRPDRDLTAEERQALQAATAGPQAIRMR